MDPSSQKTPSRGKLITVGLYLSKFDSLGLKALGFETFVEAFNVIGYALGARPGSVKNYRDEFDPYFPNGRKGWHKRAARGYCLKILEQYKDLDFEAFTLLVKSFVASKNTTSFEWGTSEVENSESQFAKRLVTGVAAERYFESVHSLLPELNSYGIHNTTQLGCGYDFRLEPQASGPFLAVEVKGLRERTGSISLTEKEYEVAAAMKERYFLFLVTNFQETPCHEIFQNPLSSRLAFTRTERKVIEVSWRTNA